MAEETAYERNLRHVVRPERPSERREADRVDLNDYEALYLQTVLEEYANYTAMREDKTDIALAYSEYIDKVVRGEAKPTLNLYVHTDLAWTVLFEALDDAAGLKRDIVLGSLHEQLLDMSEDAAVEAIVSPEE